MYCTKCYAKLDDTAKIGRCPRCDRGYDVTDRSTWLKRPFPGALRIALYIAATSIVSLVIAYIAAMFQMASASGH